MWSASLHCGPIVLGMQRGFNLGVMGPVVGCGVFSNHVLYLSMFRLTLQMSPKPSPKVKFGVRHGQPSESLSVPTYPGLGLGLQLSELLRIQDWCPQCY